MRTEIRATRSSARVVARETRHDKLFCSSARSFVGAQNTHSQKFYKQKTIARAQEVSLERRTLPPQYLCSPAKVLRAHKACLSARSFVRAKRPNETRIRSINGSSLNQERYIHRSSCFNGEIDSKISPNNDNFSNFTPLPPPPHLLPLFLKTYML